MKDFKISIIAGLDPASSSVKGSGETQHPITYPERKLFKVEDANLREAVRVYMGKLPNEVYVINEDNHYSDLGWSERIVQTIFRFKKAVIREITLEPQIISHEVFTNKSNNKGIYQTRISHTITDTVETNWSKTNTFGIEQKISYDLSFLGSGGGGTTLLSYSYMMGEGGLKSISNTLGSNSGFTIKLDPYESLNVLLTANKGKMIIDIAYEALFTGSVVVKYPDKYRGHYWWCIPIESIISSYNQFTTDKNYQIPESVICEETIVVSYYTSGNIEIKNT